MKKNKIDGQLIKNFYDKVDSGEFSKIFTLSYPIALIQKIIFANGEIFLKENYNLINSEVDVLSLLYTNNKILTPTELSELTIFSSGGMTKVLKRLEERGLIYRQENENDKRCMLVCLSDKGEELIIKSLDSVSKECFKYFESLSDYEKKTLATLLKKVVINLTL